MRLLSFKLTDWDQNSRDIHCCTVVKPRRIYTFALAEILTFGRPNGYHVQIDPPWPVSYLHDGAKWLNHNDLYSEVLICAHANGAIYPKFTRGGPEVLLSVPHPKGSYENGASYIVGHASLSDPFYI